MVWIFWTIQRVVRIWGICLQKEQCLPLEAEEGRWALGKQRWASVLSCHLRARQQTRRTEHPGPGGLPGGTGGELDSRRTGMGGATGGSICGRIWTLTAHQLDKAASQSRLYWGSSLFLFYPQEENYCFLYSWAQRTLYDKGRKCFILATSSWVF